MQQPWARALVPPLVIAIVLAIFVLSEYRLLNHRRDVTTVHIQWGESAQRAHSNGHTETSVLSTVQDELLWYYKLYQRRPQCAQFGMTLTTPRHVLGQGRFHVVFAGQYSSANRFSNRNYATLLSSSIPLAFKAQRRATNNANDRWASSGISTESTITKHDFNLIVSPQFAKFRTVYTVLGVCSVDEHDFIVSEQLDCSLCRDDFQASLTMRQRAAMAVQWTCHIYENHSHHQPFLLGDAYCQQFCRRGLTVKAVDVDSNFPEHMHKPYTGYGGAPEYWAVSDVFRREYLAQTRDGGCYIAAGSTVETTATTLLANGTVATAMDDSKSDVSDVDDIDDQEKQRHRHELVTDKFGNLRKRCRVNMRHPHEQIRTRAGDVYIIGALLTGLVVATNPTLFRHDAWRVRDVEREVLTPLHVSANQTRNAQWHALQPRAGEQYAMHFPSYGFPSWTPLSRNIMYAAHKGVDGDDGKPLPQVDDNEYRYRKTSDGSTLPILLMPWHFMCPLDGMIQRWQMHHADFDSLLSVNDSTTVMAVRQGWAKCDFPGIRFHQRRASSDDKTAYIARCLTPPQFRVVLAALSTQKESVAKRASTTDVDALMRATDAVSDIIRLVTVISRMCAPSPSDRPSADEALRVLADVCHRHAQLGSRGGGGTHADNDEDDLSRYCKCG